MDYDSSSKFISSLAKFLQSLCNGYVEFDNGVEVIGHIYLSVDTGKKIDYILNEKVCKTDENSVTFISNSFHAQPAEKPKPNSKKGRAVEQTECVESVEIDSEGNTQVEPRSTNMGTIPRNTNRNSPSLGKRPFSPHSKGGASASKKGRGGTSQEQVNFGMSDDGNLSLSAANSSSDPLRGHQNSSSLPPSNSSQSFDPGYHPGIDNSNAGSSEDRDIKPSMDTDVTFVKEEFASSQAEDERSRSIDEPFSSMYSANQSYSEGPPSQSYGQQNSRLSFGGAGDRSDNGMFDPGLSQLEGNEGAGADPSAMSRRKQRGLHRNRIIHAEPRDSDSTNMFHEIPLRCGERLNQEANMNHGIAPTFATGKQEEMSKTEPPHHCHICGTSFTLKRNLGRHLAKCAGTRYNACQFCSKIYFRSDHLSRHMRKFHPLEMINEHELLTCAYYPQVNGSKRTDGQNDPQNYVRHKNNKGTRNKSPLAGECGFCPDGFYDFETFLEHIDLVDTAMSACQRGKQFKTFRCGGGCQLSLDNLHHMREHLRAFHNYDCQQTLEGGASRFETLTDKQIFQCHHCDKTYRDKKGLKRHLEALEGVYFQCSYCGKNFSRQDTLSSHIKRLHELHMM